ncbi:MAG: hypothetical protein KTR32_33080, partial [Granulosicoccus sp.]|nr:hypothetical protein [Granulosicoccus sp.]
SHRIKLFLTGQIVEIAPFNLSPSGGVDHYMQASTCPNGVQNLTGTDSSIVPRTVGHAKGGTLTAGSTLDSYNSPDYHTFGTEHGSNVVAAFLENAPDAEIVMFNTAYFIGVCFFTTFYTSSNSDS